jgi:hypothetical protein
MPDPQLKYDREEMTITVDGLTGGWTLGQLGELSLLNSAQLQLPTMWNDYQTAVALRIFETSWRLNSRLVLEQTLEAGVEFTGADGVGQSISLDSELKYHLMERPTVQIDMTLKYGLEGSFQGGRYDGTEHAFSLGLRVRF